MNDEDLKKPIRSIDEWRSRVYEVNESSSIERSIERTPSDYASLAARRILGGLKDKMPNN